MKKVLFSLLMIFVAAAGTNMVVAQEVENGAKIEFDKEVHDYGTIENGANGQCTFDFKNTGNAPLIISNAKGSCGGTDFIETYITYWEDSLRELSFK